MRSTPSTSMPAPATRSSTLTAGGTGGNERLTVQAGALLFGILAAVGVTIVRIGQLRWEHLFIGLVLIGPVLLKLASTGYRFARYYTVDGAYRRKGPPLLVLRLLAPILVLTTVVVLASGVALLLLGPGEREPLLLVHKASFFAWLAVTTVHVLGHLGEMQRGLGLTLPMGGAGALAVPPLPGRSGRALALLSAIVLGLVLALALIPDFGVWMNYHGHHH
ncbi:MAG: hypothetical protein ACYDC2_06935 [Solirubrobacteraceae bacterium]